MNFNKRVRLAQEKFNEGLAALKTATYQLAIDSFMDAAELVKGIKGQEQTYAACLVNAASALDSLGSYNQAKTLIEKALPIQKKFLIPEHPDIAASLFKLATIYQEQGNYEQAKSLHEESLEIRRKTLPADHTDIAKSLNNLAVIYKKQGDYDQAKSLHEKSLEIRRKVLPAYHPDIAGSLNNLANIYLEQGNYEQATSLWEQVKYIWITLLHEAVFQFLTKEYENNITIKERVTLRTSKNDEQGRLSKGYWFLGDDEQLYFSCWKGIDSNVQMPTIAIVIDTQPQVTLQFNGKDSAKKAEFLADLTKLLDGFSQSSDVHGKLEARWRKTYSQETWQEALEEFFTTDKQQIDEYLAVNNSKVEDFTPIPAKEFAQSLKFTLFLREKLKETTATEIRELSEVGKPLKLQSLQLENIGHFKEVGFDLSKQVTILIGENGSGKSTVLKAIALGLSNVAQTMDMALVQDYLRIVKTDADKEHNSLKKQYCPTGEIRLGFQLNKLQTQTLEFKTTDLGGVEINPFIENNDDWLLVSQNRFIDLILGFPQGKKRSQKSLAKIEAPNLNDVLALIEERDTPEWKLDIKKWIYHLHAQRDENPQNLEKINTVFELFSKIIADEDNEAFIRLKDVVYNQETREEDVIICTPDMPEGISLDLISQGYNNIFVWIGRLIMRLYDALKVHQQEHHAVSKDNKFLKNLNKRGKRYEANSIYEIHGIVLIDEIDTYLHPKWQRNILQVLAETFPCLQFVVTSHSSMVLGYLKQWKNASVFKVKADEIIPIHHFYGRNEIDLFWELHGIEARPKEIQEKISALYSAFDANELTQSKVLLTELREILGENDPIIVELATAIELMEELS